MEFAHQTGSTSLDNWADYMTNGSNAYITSDSVSTYTYDSSGRLTCARDELSQYEVNYAYTNGKVTSISEYAGPSLTKTLGQQVGITYSDGYTVLRTSGNDDVYNNSDDILTRYSFDNEGRTVSIYSTDIYGKNIYDASNGEYETGNENAKNSIKTSAVVGGTSANYLLNGGFELNGAGSLSYLSTSGTVSTSSLIPYNSKFNANLTISSGTTSKIEQYAFLPQGEYTLSMNINTFDSNDLTIVMTATSLSNGSNAYTEEISYNEYYASGQYAYVSMNFNAGSYINGGEKFKITIQVTGGTSTAANYCYLCRQCDA